MSQSEVQAFFDQQAALWDYSFDEHKLEQIRNLFKKYLKKLNGPALDLGCGTGVLLKIMPEFLANPETLILELDLSLPMLQQAREKARFLEQKVGLLQADGQQLPLATGSLGDIIAFQVFPHFLAPQNVLNEAFRTLRSEGRFVILHLMNHEKLNALHRNANDVVAEHYLPPVQILTQHIAKVGFRIETSIEKENCYFIIGRRS